MTSNIHIVRINSCGSVGRYASNGAQAFERGELVVCRTQRGLEPGEVLACITEGRDAELDGDVLRSVGQNDESRLAQLAAQRSQAIEACQALMDLASNTAVVVDAVFPLDGQHICFYVLGSLDSSMNDIAREIGTQFNVNVQFRPVTDDGAGSCGSGECGESGGCSTGDCAGCPAAGDCRQ